RMAPRALGLRVLLRVLVAAQAVAHLGHGVHRGERLREPLVTGRAVLLDAVDVLLVAHLHQALGDRALRGVLDVRVAEAAVVLFLLLLVALEARVFRGQRLGRGAERGLVEHALVAGDALDVVLGVDLVRSADPIAGRVGRRRPRRRGPARDEGAAGGGERDEGKRLPHGVTFFAR